MSCTQRLGQGPRTLTNPPQRRFRTPRVWASTIASKVSTNRGSTTVNGLAPGPEATDAARRRRGSVFDLTGPVGNRLAREAAGPLDDTDAAIPQRDRFTGRHESPGAFVEQGPHGHELRRQLRKTVHGQAAQQRSFMVDTFIYLHCLTMIRNISRPRSITPECVVPRSQIANLLPCHACSRARRATDLCSESRLQDTSSHGSVQPLRRRLRCHEGLAPSAARVLCDHRMTRRPWIHAS